MKVLAAAVSAALLAVMAGGCNDTSTARRYQAGALRPAIMLEAPTEMSVRESQRLIAHSRDTVAAKTISWTVSPTNGKVTPEKSTGGQSALFTADQRGRYIVTVTVDPGNGESPVMHSAAIDVIGGPTASDQIVEPVR